MVSKWRPSSGCEANQAAVTGSLTFVAPLARASLFKIQVAMRDGPFVVGLDLRGIDQAGDGGSFGEDADDVGAARDLAIYA